MSPPARHETAANELAPSPQSSSFDEIELALSAAPSGARKRTALAQQSAPAVESVRLGDALDGDGLDELADVDGAVEGVGGGRGTLLTCCSGCTIALALLGLAAFIALLVLSKNNMI